MDAEKRDPAVDLLEPKSAEGDLLKQVEDTANRGAYEVSAEAEAMANDEGTEEIMIHEVLPEPELFDEFGAPMELDSDDGQLNDLYYGLSSRNSVMKRYGETTGAAIVDFIFGARCVASMVVDYAPVIGDIKGVVESVFGWDEISGEELGFTSRIMGLFCLTELRRLLPGKRAEEAISESVEYVSSNLIRKNAGKADDLDPLSQALTNRRKVREGVREDMRQQRRAQLAKNRTQGARAQSEVKPSVEEAARKNKGTFEEGVRQREGPSHVEFDFRVRVKEIIYVVEVKGTIWKAKSYAKPSGVKAMLNRIGKQVARHKNAMKQNGSYIVIFRIPPSGQWQMDLILEWAKKMGIMVQFENLESLT